MLKYLQIFAYDKQGNQFIEPGFGNKEEFEFDFNNYFVHKSKTGVIDIKLEDEVAIVTSGDKEYVFSLKDGRSLISIKVEGQNVFRELPRLNFLESSY